MGNALERGKYGAGLLMDRAADIGGHQDRPVTEMGIDELVRYLLEDKARGFEVVRLEGRGDAVYLQAGAWERVDGDGRADLIFVSY